MRQKYNNTCKLPNKVFNEQLDILVMLGVRKAFDTLVVVNRNLENE